VKWKIVRRSVKNEDRTVHRDIGLAAMWAEGESISFELLYLIAYLLSYKPT
jgi:hypothetical protein